jgi:hypothetical protein
MKKYALVNNGAVTQTIEIEEEYYSDFIKLNEMVIDITDDNPQPVMGWVMNGNKLQIPQNLSSREEFEIDLNSRKSEFGIKLSKSAVDRIGARNKILNKNGSQVISLLTQLLGIKSLLETGALGTARYSCIQLKAIYVEYADIFDEIINKINDFERNFGL